MFVYMFWHDVNLQIVWSRKGVLLFIMGVGKKWRQGQNKDLRYEGKVAHFMSGWRVFHWEKSFFIFFCGKHLDLWEKESCLMCLVVQQIYRKHEKRRKRVSRGICCPCASCISSFLVCEDNQSYSCRQGGTLWVCNLFILHLNNKIKKIYWIVSL